MEKSTDIELISKVQAVLAEALQISLEQVTPDLAFGDIPQWDSMGHMEVMILLEQYFGVEINAETISQLTSIPAICASIADGLKE